LSSCTNCVNLDPFTCPSGREMDCSKEQTALNVINPLELILTV